ncbi:MAG: hypothetical protein OHK0013_34920 [Sandaracinaceae bacterium]
MSEQRKRKRKGADAQAEPTVVRADAAEVAPHAPVRSGGRGRRRGMATVAELLPRVIPHEPDEAMLFRVMAFWERSLPHRMVRNARPVTLKKGVLYVHTTTSAWAQEVVLRSRDLLDRLRRGVPKASVRELRVRTGQLPDRIVPPPPVERRVVPVDELPAVLEVALEKVRDPKLRELLAAAARTSLGKVVVVERER